MNNKIPSTTKAESAGFPPYGTGLSLDLTSKKAVGTAAGFVGLFGYLGRTCENVGFGWMLKHGHAQAGAGTAWNQIIWAILACTAMAIVLMTFTWKLKPRDTRPGPDRVT